MSESSSSVDLSWSVIGSFIVGAVFIVFLIGIFFFVLWKLNLTISIHRKNHSERCFCQESIISSQKPSETRIIMKKEMTETNDDENSSLASNQRVRDVKVEITSNGDNGLSVIPEVSINCNSEGEPETETLKSLEHSNCKKDKKIQPELQDCSFIACVMPEHRPISNAGSDPGKYRKRSQSMESQRLSSSGIRVGLHTPRPSSTWTAISSDGSLTFENFPKDCCVVVVPRSMACQAKCILCGQGKSCAASTEMTTAATGESKILKMSAKSNVVTFNNEDNNNNMKSNRISESSVYIDMGTREERLVQIGAESSSTLPINFKTSKRNFFIKGPNL